MEAKQKAPRPASPNQVGYLLSLATSHAIFGDDVDQPTTTTMMTAMVDAGLTFADARTLLDRAVHAPDRRPPTEPQLALLTNLASRRLMYGNQVSAAETLARVRSAIAAGLTRTSVAALIAQAQLSPVRPAADTDPASSHLIKRLRNLAADYAIYGLGVSQEDTIARLETDLGTAPTRGTAESLFREIHQHGRTLKPHPTADTGIPLNLIPGMEGLTVYEGHFAVSVEETLRFYRIYQPLAKGIREETAIRRFASDQLKAITPAEALAAVTVIAADPDTAAYRFADEHTRCWMCGRALTDAVSRYLSVGPVCRNFPTNQGLRSVAATMDNHPNRGKAFRALREWAVATGLKDPRTKQEREQHPAKTPTATLVASAWSALPGIAAMDPTQAVNVVSQAIGETLTEEMAQRLLAADAETVLVLIDAGVLTAAIMRTLQSHASPKVTAATGTYFLDILIT